MQAQQLQFGLGLTSGNYPAGFWPWLENNRHVYREFVKLAKRMKRAGRARYGAKGIVEVLRWNTNLKQVGEPELKLNNNYTSGLARLAMSEHPELKGFFQIRDGLGRNV